MVNIECGGAVSPYSQVIHNYAIRWNNGLNLLKISFGNGSITERFKINVVFNVSHGLYDDPASEMGEHNGHFYIIWRKAVTWQEARDYCRSVGGHLATITIQGEQNYLDWLNIHDLDLWIVGQGHVGE